MEIPRRYQHFEHGLVAHINFTISVEDIAPWRDYRLGGYDIPFCFAGIFIAKYLNGKEADLHR